MKKTENNERSFGAIHPPSAAYAFRLYIFFCVQGRKVS